MKFKWDLLTDEDGAYYRTFDNEGIVCIIYRGGTWRNIQYMVKYRDYPGDIYTDQGEAMRTAYRMMEHHYNLGRTLGVVL